MLTRDVRLTADEIVALEDAARRRIAQLTRSINAAEKRRSLGDPIQEGTLDRHIYQRGKLMAARDSLGVARQQLARRFAEHVRSVS